MLIGNKAFLSGIISLILIVPFISSGQNIALTSKCVVFPAPNYVYTKNKNNASFLINNKTATRSPFWLDTETLGWQKAPKVQIDFTLQSTQNISKVSLSTASSKAAGALLPLNVYVFTSLDGKKFSLLGDMMSKGSRGSDAYHKTTLSLSGLNAKANYVRLVAVPMGALFFTDEVEIIKSTTSEKVNAIANVKQVATMADNDIDKLLASNTGLTINKSFLLQEIETFKQVNKKNGTALDKLKLGLTGSGINDQQYDQYKKNIYRTLVNNSISSGILVTELKSPWEDRLATLKELSAGTGRGVVSKKIFTAVNATEYTSFIIFNNTTSNQNAKIDWNNNGRVTAVYQTQEIKARNNQIVNDALLPIVNAQNLQLAPGEFKTIVVSINSKQPGQFNDVINLNSTSAKSSLQINTQVVAPALNLAALQGFTINNWAYFNFPFVKGIKPQVRADLINHYINTTVIPPQVALPGVVDKGYVKLKAYLNDARGFKNVLLFINYRQKPADFLSDGWKKNFLQWYDDVMVILKQDNIDLANVYLYPFDEVKVKEVNDFVNFSKWIKGARKDAKIFSTITNGPTLTKIKPYADVLQILDRGENYSEEIPTGTKTWIYDIMDNSKSLSPYSRYRLLAWKAFAHKATGIGFWNYADIAKSTGGGSIWNDFDGSYADYNVVYNLDEKIISSRRWEAFKAGIEDYALLKTYQAKFGEAKAQQLCSQVMSDASDTQTADRVREAIIRALSNN